MAFTVENGSGVTGANAYIAVVFFREYHADRGRVTTPAIDDAAAQVSIVRASDYIDQRFGQRFRGDRQQKSQGLEWPRISAFDNDGYLLDDVPSQIQRACAEYALRAFVLGELLPDAPRAAPSQNLADPAAPVTGAAQPSGVVRSQARQVGPLRTSNTFMSQAEVQALLRDRSAMAGGLVSGVYIPEYPAADLWLQEVIDTARRRVVRA